MSVDFQNYLSNELQRRLADNPRYSLRAFARDLDIEPSLLSKILRRKIPLTDGMFQRISTRLRLPGDILNTLKWTTFPEGLEDYSVDEPSVDYIAVEEFLMISDWYHYAILEMTSLKDFRPEALWFTERLGLPLEIIEPALERLLKLGLLVQTESGWQTSSRFSSTLKQQSTSQALRNRQCQVLQKAIHAIETAPVEARDNSAITLALNLKVLPAVQQKIKHFRRMLATFIEEESRGEQTEVYELAIALFPLTHQPLDKDSEEPS